jgi:hypothetical protein
MTETMLGAAGMGLAGGAGIAGLGSGAISGSAGGATTTLGSGIPVGGLPFLGGTGGVLSDVLGGLGGRGPLEQRMDQDAWQQIQNARTKSSAGVGPDTPDPGNVSKGDGPPGITVQSVFFKGQTMYVVFKGLQNPVPYSDLPSNIRKKVDAYLKGGSGGGNGSTGQTASPGGGQRTNRAADAERSGMNVTVDSTINMEFNPRQFQKKMQEIAKREAEKVLKRYNQSIGGPGNAGVR